MYKKLTCAALLALGLTGCDRQEEPTPMNDYTFQGAYEAGSYEDFKQTAGDRIFFALNASHISKDAAIALDKQIAWLLKYPNAMLTIEGHADERGTSEYNLGLGERRAHAVRNYLKTHGIDEKRISTVSFGKERPDVMGHNEAAWAKNRRAVTVIH